MSEHTKGLGNGVETADRKKIEGLLGQLTPFDLREAEDIACMRRYLACFDNLLTRQNTAMHLSSSSLILDESGQNTLLCWHNIYRSWSWTGGHADGDADLLAVALREAQEETGAVCRPFSQPGAAAPLAFDILPVWAHEKRGRAVAAHLHLNFTFLLQAGQTAPGAGTSPPHTGQLLMMLRFSLKV